MNTPTEFVRVRTAQGTFYTLMVSLMPAEVAVSISDMWSIHAISVEKPISKLIHILSDARLTNGVQNTLEQNPANTNIVENYLEHNLH